MHDDVETRHLVEHRLERPRAFGARDLDPILRPVGEPLLGSRQAVEVAGGQADRAQELAHGVDHASATSTGGAPRTTHAVSRACRSVVNTISFARAKLSSSVGTGPTGCPSA